jgi:hypothetical protein
VEARGFCVVTILDSGAAQRRSRCALHTHTRRAAVLRAARLDKSSLQYSLLRLQGALIQALEHPS